VLREKGPFVPNENENKAEVCILSSEKRQCSDEEQTLKVSSFFFSLLMTDIYRDHLYSKRGEAGEVTFDDKHQSLTISAYIISILRRKQHRWNCLGGVSTVLK
jgi:hypothetical protein